MAEIFELLQELGKGGFATTYKARVIDPDLLDEFGTEIVAIKIPLSKQKERVLRRELELNAGIHMRLRGLRSVHIVRYLGFVSFRDQIAMVMEYVEQGSLRRLLGRSEHQSALPVLQAVEIAEGLLDGLATIHDEGILHRDIKPENILMQGSIAKIADLGISRMLDEDELALTFAGTTPYIAPEILSSHGATFSADLWSAAVTLYEMLTGRMPFGDGRTPLRTMIEQICEAEAEPPSRVLAGLPPDLDAIVRCGLGKRPEDRYASAREMRNALAEWRSRYAGLPLTVASLDAVTVAPAGSSVRSSRSADPDLPTRRETPRPRPTPPPVDVSTQPSLDQGATPPSHRSALEHVTPPAADHGSPRTRVWIGLAAAAVLVVAIAATYLTRPRVSPQKPDAAVQRPPALTAKADPPTTSVPPAAPVDPPKANPADVAAKPKAAAKTPTPVPAVANVSDPPASTAAMLEAALKTPSNGPAGSTERSPERACESGDARGCYELGELYSNGRGVAKDDARAASFYDRGCQSGLAASCYRLGLLYRDERGVSRNMVKATGLFQRSCDGGVPDACTDLGFAYGGGRGVVKDETRAADLFRKACDGGHGLGCSRLAFALADGRGVAKDDVRAAAMFQRACDIGFLNGCDWIGIKYTNGIGVAKDEKRAVALFDRACTGGDRGGCNDLGLAYERGTGVASDLTKAIGLYQRACDMGNPVACVNLGWVYFSNDRFQTERPRASSLFQQACETNNPRGCNLAGRAFAEGKGVAVDQKRANEYFQRACDGGLGIGCLNIGVRYRNGFAPLAKDEAMAAKLFQRACDLKVADGCANLANAYMEGRGVEKDAARAAEYARRGRELAGGDAAGTAPLTPPPAAALPAPSPTTWLSGDDYQNLWNRQTANGFHPGRLDGRLNEGREEFRATWERTIAGCRFVSHRAMTRETFDRDNAQYEAEGYTARVTTFVGLAGVTRYQAVWTKGCTP